jgi:hypothetical protein
MTAHASNYPQRPWFREPMMWVVLGLPGSVVIAGFITLAIAIEHRDRAPSHAGQASVPLHCIETGNRKLPPDCR